MAEIKKKQIVKIVVGFVSVLLFCILTVISNRQISSLTDQQVAINWGGEKEYAQVSCMFTKDAGISEMSLISFRHRLESLLREESLWPEDSLARAFVDSYSGNGQISVSNSRANLTLDAIGVGGDFFLFHPIELLSGTYFDGNMLMQDYIIIDEDAAWQLFGSYDIAGMKVMVGNVEHTIMGVAKRDQSKVAKAAGLSESTAYVSCTTLENVGSFEGITTYEAVLPNPVENYAFNTIKENLGVSEESVELIENTKRYSAKSLLKVIGDFGKRSMQTKSVVYPYWENIARYYEDVLAVLFIFRLICLFIPLMMILVWVIRLWKRRRFTIKSLAKTVGALIVKEKDACIKKMKKKGMKQK